MSVEFERRGDQLMKGVLIVGHGSRRKETELILESVVEMARKGLPEMPVEIAFMELSESSIPVGLDALAAQGANEIAVVPYFLYDGVHIREDIPEALEEYMTVHPKIKITMGKPLGEDERLGAILADRIQGALESL
jgi:sirohydrochlorin ferrochelatase